MCVLRLLRLQPQGSLDGLHNSALEKGLLKLLVQLVIMWCILYDVSPAAVWQVCGTGALLELGCGVGRVAQLSRMLQVYSPAAHVLGVLTPLPQAPRVLAVFAKFSAAHADLQVKDCAAKLLSWLSRRCVPGERRCLSVDLLAAHGWPTACAHH